MRLNRSDAPVFAGRLLFVLPALLAGVTACSSASAPPSGPPPPMPVQFEVLESSPIEQVGNFVGTIKSLRTMTVQPQAEGFLTRILTRSGARVSPGAPLFEIDAGGQQAVVSSLEAQRTSREADAAYARQQTQRAESLVKVGAGSQQELDQAAAALKTAEAQLQAIEQQIRQQQVELNYYRVVAQTSGVVGDIPVRVGDRVTRSTVLTTVDDNAGLEVYINVPIPQAPLASAGVPIRILDADGAVLAESKISFIASSVDDQTQTLLVKAPITPAEGTTLRSDQIVRAQLVWSVDSGLRVPVIAVQRINSRHFVFVAEQTPEGGLVARQRPVTVGAVIGSDYIVREGLTAGERVILAGTQKIGDGAPVQMLPATPPPAASGGR